VLVWRRARNFSDRFSFARSGQNFQPLRVLIAFSRALR
jgi:hypothetical protein